MTGETIVILANAEWDWANRVNCHHIASRLASNNDVIFVETVGGRTPAPREMGKIWRRLRHIARGLRRIDNVTVLSPFVVPFYGNDIVRGLNTRLVAYQIKSALLPRVRPILWIFIPSLVGLIGQLNEKLVIYHCVDDHAANPNVPARRVREWEQRLVGGADVVFTTASTLYETKRSFGTSTFYLPNVADADHFGQAREATLPVAQDLQNIRRPIAGFIGNVSAYKVDLELLCDAARQMPEWSFVLIGPVGRGDPSTRLGSLAGVSNIHLLGERAYADLPCYVKGFDACLIPFNQNESTRSSFPMKFFEYLATGKPVIATDLPSLSEFRDLFYPIHNAEELCDALAASQTETSDRIARRLDAAQHYSWDARMIQIDRILEQVPLRAPTTWAFSATTRAQRVIKRIGDVLLAILLMIVLSPILLLIALAIRLSSGSPVLYTWNVVGQNGRPVRSFKFRTMVEGADKLKEQLIDQNEMKGPVFKMKDDPRVTPVGRVLRKHSLDELPQLWSVVKGDMSLVGPRPPLTYEYARFTPQQRQKLAVRPGMTSLWQVSGKPSDFAEWLRLDLEYIDRWSLWLDFQILLKTTWVVLTGKNY